MLFFPLQSVQWNEGLQTLKTNFRFASAARSTNGCWTCRVRKKKCNEARPFCSTCLSLKLECHGYGARPVWMDNGPLQKEQALRFKRIVGQNNHKTRKRRHLHSPRMPLPELDTARDTTPTALASFLNYNSGELPLDMSALDTPVSENWNQSQPWSTNLTTGPNYIPNQLPERNPLTAESLFDTRNWERSMWFGDTLSGGHDPNISETSQVSQFSDAASSSTPNMSSSQNSAELSIVRPREMMDQGSSVPFGSTSLLGEFSTRAQSLSANKDMKDSSVVSILPEESSPHDELEDNLFMHYLDEVFFIQYPFYNSPKKRSRGWIFSSVKRSKSVHHATIALSQRHLVPTADTSMLSTLPGKRNYHEMALQELQASSGESNISNNIPRITCLLQLIFYEVRPYSS